MEELFCRRNGQARLCRSIPLNIDIEKTIWQNFSDEQELIMLGGRQINSRAFLSRFNFSGSEQNKKVSTLSGGERNRLHLAMTLKEEGMFCC